MIPGQLFLRMQEAKHYTQLCIYQNTDGRQSAIMLLSQSTCFQGEGGIGNKY